MHLWVSCHSKGDSVRLRLLALEFDINSRGVIGVLPRGVVVVGVLRAGVDPPSAKSPGKANIFV
jgi:hypothetical protein